MKTLFTLTSLLLSLSVLAGEVSPKRGLSTCNAQNPCDTEIVKTDTIKTSAASTAKAPAIKPTTSRVSAGDPGNLPTYYNGAKATSSTEGNVIIVPEKISGALLPGLRAGDILQAEIEQSIKASPSVPTPIRARVTAGRFRGAFVLGSATFDRELKRVLVQFERLRLPRSDTSYQLKASVLALSGQVGLEGNFHTEEGTYFAAELGAAAAAGYADATTSRSQSVLGGYQVEPTAANAAKQGAVQALSKTAERFAERARTAPEYTEIEGGRAIQIIIQEAPTEVSS